jgi:hypothetical protein
MKIYVFVCIKYILLLFILLYNYYVTPFSYDGFYDGFHTLTNYIKIFKN